MKSTLRTRASPDEIPQWLSVVSVAWSLNWQAGRFSARASLPPISEAHTLEAPHNSTKSLAQGWGTIPGGGHPLPPVTSMGTLNFFMKRTASVWPSSDRLKQPSRSAASESAPASVSKSAHRECCKVH
jgi:hypothetical protein